MMLLWRRSELIGRVSIFVDPSTPVDEIDAVCQKEVERQEAAFQQRQAKIKELASCASSSSSSICPASPQILHAAGWEIIDILSDFGLTGDEAKKVLTKVFQSITFGQVPEAHVVRQ